MTAIELPATVLWGVDACVLAFGLLFPICAWHVRANARTFPFFVFGFGYKLEKLLLAKMCVRAQKYCVQGGNCGKNVYGLLGCVRANARTLMLFPFCGMPCVEGGGCIWRKKLKATFFDSVKR